MTGSLTIIRTILLLCLLLLSGCGGGGGGSAPAAGTSATALLKLSALPQSGTPLAGAGVTLLLPAGVTPKLDQSGEVAAGVVQASGAAAPGSVLAQYLPASGGEKGRLVVAIASGLPAGFRGGEFGTVTLQVAAGTTVSAGDFALTGFAAISTSGTTLTEYTASFQAVFQ